LGDAGGRSSAGQGAQSILTLAVGFALRHRHGYGLIVMPEACLIKFNEPPYIGNSFGVGR
jgi:hypothetical protein